VTLLNELGITRRQLSYWIEKGWLRPAGGGGQGNPFTLPPDEITVARAMVRLTGAGLSPEVACRVAREHRTATVIDALGGSGPDVHVHVSEPYRFLVEDGERHYDGDDLARGIEEFSKALGRHKSYVTLEAIKHAGR